MTGQASCQSTSMRSRYDEQSGTGTYGLSFSVLVLDVDEPPSAMVVSTMIDLAVSDLLQWLFVAQGLLEKNKRREY